MASWFDSPMREAAVLQSTTAPPSGITRAAAQTTPKALVRFRAIVC